MALVPQDITDISYIISERFEKVNTEYIKRMAEHIKHLGKLKPSDMHELEIMARMSVDTKEINEMLAKETGLAINDIYKVYDESGLRAYQDTSIYYEAKGITQIPFSENANMQAYMNSIKEATANTFVNMANTTVIDNTYKTAIDNAIQIISSGYADNNARLRRVIKDNVAGARVTYKSGVTRRLDSACRMNILDGTRRINRGIRKIAGQEFGADGVEVDAHGLCAEDHIDIQGKQYSIKKYELLNSNLKREIGTCNCGHNITYIILGVSKPAWDDDDLKQARQYSTDKVEFKGKEMTRYEASQKMRQMETAMRYKKDEIIGLKTAGYDVTKEEKQLRAIQSNYRQLCNVAELKPRYERAYVPGYRGGGNNVKPTPVRRVPKTETTLKTSIPKPSEIRDVFIDKDSYINEDIYKTAFKKHEDTLRQRSDIHNRIKEVEAEISKHTATPKPKKEWNADDLLNSIMGKTPMIQSKEAQRLEKQLDKLWKEYSEIGKEGDKAYDTILALDKKNYIEQAKKWEFTKPKKTDITDFDGFSTKMHIAQYDEDLENGIGYIAEMSPQEYLERCAYDIFHNTYESTVLGTSPKSVVDYAKAMNEGVKFDMGYLDYENLKQEGRHRAMSAYLLGIDKIPVYIRGL